MTVTRVDHDDGGRVDTMTRTETLKARGYPDEIINGNGNGHGPAELVQQVVLDEPESPACSVCSGPIPPARARAGSRTCDDPECIRSAKRARQRAATERRKASPPDRPAVEVSRISEIRLAPVAAQVTTEQAATDASPSWPAGAVAGQPEAANGWAAMLGALERAGAQVAVPQCGVRRPNVAPRGQSVGMSRRGGRLLAMPSVPVLPATVNTPDRSRRISALWTARPDLTETEIAARVDAELAEEATRRAESERYAQEMVDSVMRMTACGACGSPGGRWSPHSGLCERCYRVEQVILAERAAAEPIAGGVDRRATVERYLAWRAGRR